MPQVLLTAVNMCLVFVRWRRQWALARGCCQYDFVVVVFSCGLHFRLFDLFSQCVVVPNL